MECPTTLATTTATTILSPTTSTTSSSQATATQATASASASNTSEHETRRHYQSLAEPLERIVQTFVAEGGVSQAQNSDLPASQHSNPVPRSMITFNIIVQPREVTVLETNQVNCERAEVERAEMMPVNSTCNFNYAATQVSDDKDNDDSSGNNDNEKDHEITKMEVTESGKLTLLLVGRTGHGKSSTGNSILGRKVFTPSESTAAITADILKGEAVIDGQEITVVDGPGIGDASFDNPEAIRATLVQVNEALNLCPNGFSVLLIVLRYGIDFTKQEKDTITMIKSIFGPDVVRKYGVIVMSHGDSFELDTEHEKTSFEDWCKEQTGDVRALFTECDNKCLLFNNWTKEPEKLQVQYESLMSKVANIHFRNKNENYTLTQYKEAEKGRKKLLVQSKLPQIEKETRTKLDDISHTLDQLERSADSSEEFQRKLENCSKEIEKLKTYLHYEDEGTGCTEQLHKRVKLVEMKIQAKRGFSQAMEQPKQLAVRENNYYSITQWNHMLARGRNSLWTYMPTKENISQWASFFLSNGKVRIDLNRERGGMEESSTCHVEMTESRLRDAEMDESYVAYDYKKATSEEEDPSHINKKNQ